MKQLDIFNMMYESYKPNKKIWLIELFCGYGSQKLALDYLGIPNESGFACDFDKVAIDQYNKLHGTNYPPTDITKVERLPIKNNDEYDTWLTYSFPCTDISNAGKMAGIKVGTRSGLLYEVQRLLEREREDLPKVLIMENVQGVLTIDDGEPFKAWISFLSNLGYTSYTEILNARDYYIPQNRKRCFCVSILGEYAYSFLDKIPLKYRLKDFLEKDVDENYYLTEKMINYIVNRTPLGSKNNYANNLIGKECEKNAGTLTARGSGSGSSVRGEDTLIVTNKTQKEIDEEIYLKNKNLKEKLCTELIEKNLVKENDIINHSYNWGGERPLDEVEKYDDNISPTLTTRPDTLGVTVVDLKRGYSCEIKNEETETEKVDILGSYSKSNYNQTSIVGKNGIAPTVLNNKGEVTAIPIKNGTKQGYLLAQDGDGLDLETREGRRGRVQKGIIQTLNTQDNKGVVVKEPEVIGGVGEKKSNNDTQWYLQNRVYDGDVAITTTTTCNPYYKTDLRIRKLTEKECFRLMGIKNTDISKFDTSKAQKYKLAGNSIVVQVLMGIFGKLYGMSDDEIVKKIKESVEQVKE